jgi:hypothetical protein
MTASLYHEVGHSIDYFIGKRIEMCGIKIDAKHPLHSSVSENFNEICKEEFMKSELDTYFSDTKEYFAEAFARSLLEKSFKYKCPKTKKYMEKFVKEILPCASW